MKNLPPAPTIVRLPEIVIPIKHGVEGGPVVTLVCELVLPGRDQAQDDSQLKQVGSEESSPTTSLADLGGTYPAAVPCSWGGLGTWFRDVRMSGTRPLLTTMDPIRDKTYKRTDHPAPGMASAWRVISFFVVVFILPTMLISLPLYARYHLYYQRHLSVTETDTRALHDTVNSFWCQGQRLQSNTSMNAFKVHGVPQQLEERRNVTFDKTLTLTYDEVEYWSMYLLEGSTFSVSSCARWPGGTLLVVKGEDNHRKCFYKEAKLQEELNEGQVHYRDFIQNIRGNATSTNDNSKTLSENDAVNGGEVFDDDLEEDIFSEKGRVVNEYYDYEENVTEIYEQDDLGEVSIAKTNVDEKVKSHKYQQTNKKLQRKLRKQKKKSNKNNKINKINENIESVLNQDDTVHHERKKRYAHRYPRIHSTSGSLGNGSQNAMDNLALLRTLNDTLDVTSGNSSISSSEEFLMQCSDALLAIDLSSYDNCAERVEDMSSANPDVWQITVDSSDHYYFILTSDNSIELNNLNLKIQIQKTVYDVRTPVATCQNDTCEFELGFTESSGVVVEIPGGDHLHDLHDYELTTVCQPRVAVYMTFILLVPFIILFFAFQ